MDPCTQGLLGASFAASFAKKDKLKIALVCGLIGGISPDLDVLIKSTSDPLLFIEYHRHFTHSLIFIPFGGIIVSSFLYFFLKNKMSFIKIYKYSTLGYFTHGLLDACTSYGTNLLWPFIDSRVSFNIISIVDPIYTSILLIFITLSFLFKTVLINRIGLALSFSYLILGLIKYEQVTHFIADIAKDRKHNMERIILNPTFGNNILWRTVYKSDEYYYVDAVYMPLLSKPILKEGVRVNVINKETIFPEIKTNSVQRDDIRRFSYFSQDFIYIHPDDKNLIADLRYGTLPYDDRSLWGIKIDVNDDRKHVTFKNLRNFTESQLNEFWFMLKGNFK